MTEDLQHLLPPYRAHAQKSNQERAAFINAPRWIQYHRAKLALERLDDLLSYPTRERMPCLLIFGRSGMGKTQILTKFVRDHPPTFDKKSGYASIPVVAMQMPPERPETHFHRELLRAMGAPVEPGMPPRNLLDLSRHMLKLVGARVLVIDEVNSMLMGTYRQQRTILNTMKFLSNDLRIPIVCAGTEESRIALSTDQQMADRFEAFELRPWQNDEDLEQFLDSFCSILPLRRPSSLSEPAVRRRILGLTEGITTRICRFVELAALKAIESGREAMEVHDLQDEDLRTLLISMQDPPRGPRRRFASHSAAG